MPDLLGLVDRAGVHGTLCCLSASGLALLAWANDENGDGRGAELCVLAPPGSDALADHVAEVLEAWDAAGRPLDTQLEIRAYRRGTSATSPPRGITIDQRWTRFVLSWAQPPAILTV